MFETLFKYPMKLFEEGTIRFSGPFQLELRIIGIIALALVVIWLYRRAPQRVKGGKKWSLAALRIIAVGLLLLILFPPVLETKETKTDDRFVAFLMDDSRSMTIEDASDGKTRLEAAVKVLAGKSGEGADGAFSSVSEVCGVRMFGFERELARIPDIGALKAEGDATDLYTAVRGVDEEMRGVPLAGVVLISDGNHNGRGDPLNAARLLAARGVPMYTVGLGDPTRVADREILAVQAPRTARRNANVDIVVTVSSHEYTDEFEVLLRKGDRTVATRVVTPASASDIQRVRIPLMLSKEGSHTYRVEIPPEQGEKIVDNNARDFRIRVKEHRLPVLYIEGSPRTEFRYVRGAMVKDKDFRIVSILRLGGDRYLVQGAETDPELLKGFPKTREKLFAYEAIIFGDIEAKEFSKEQLAMVEEFVRKRGGGFLMLGGVNSFNRGGFVGTPIEKLLPIRLASKSVRYDHREFRIKAATRGLTHAVMRQHDDPVTNNNIWNTVSPLIGRNPVKGLKPAATALMELLDTGEPVLAVQNYGSGRSAAFTTGGSWYWRMNRKIEDQLHDRFWKQLVRWLAVGSKPKLSIELSRDIVSLKEPLKIKATVLGKSLEPVNDAIVTAHVEDPFGNSEEVSLEWILTEDGVYSGRVRPREEGEFTVTVKADTGKDNAPLEAKVTFTVAQSPIEFSGAWQNEQQLKDLAELTGGKYYTEKDVANLAKDIREHIEKDVHRNQEYKARDLWDMPALFVILTVLLSIEWLFRRRSGLP